MKKSFVFILAWLIVCSSFASGEVFKKGGKYGAMDSLGTVVLPPVFTFIGDFNPDGLAIVRQKIKGKVHYGVVNRDYRLICQPTQKVVFLTPTQQDYIEDDMDMLPVFTYGFTPDGNDTLFYSDGTVMTGLQTCYLPNVHGIRIYQSTDKNFGLMGSDGRVLLEAQYPDYFLYRQEHRLPEDSLWGVLSQSVYGVVDITGRVVVPFAYKKAIRLGKHLTATSEDGSHYDLWRDSVRLTNRSYNGFNFPTEHAIVFALNNSVGMYIWDAQRETRPYSTYIGAYEADTIHGSTLHLFGDVVGKDTTYSILNDWGNEVIPKGLVKSKTEAENAIAYLRVRTVDVTNALALRRFRLGISRNVRKYPVTAIIPASDWDY